MAEVFEKIKFPCGYEHTMLCKFGTFEMASINAKTELKICPLHGQRCK